MGTVHGDRNLRVDVVARRRLDMRVFGEWHRLLCQLVRIYEARLLVHFASNGSRPVRPLRLRVADARVVHRPVLPVEIKETAIQKAYDKVWNSIRRRRSTLEFQNIAKHLCGCLDRAHPRLSTLEAIRIVVTEQETGRSYEAGGGSPPPGRSTLTEWRRCLRPYRRGLAITAPSPQQSQQPSMAAAAGSHSEPRRVSPLAERVDEHERPATPGLPISSADAAVHATPDDGGTVAVPHSSQQHQPQGAAGKRRVVQAGRATQTPLLSEGLPPPQRANPIAVVSPPAQAGRSRDLPQGRNQGGSSGSSAPLPTR